MSEESCPYLGELFFPCLHCLLNPCNVLETRGLWDCAGACREPGRAAEDDCGSGREDVLRDERD